MPSPPGAGRLRPPSHTGRPPLTLDIASANTTERAAPAPAPTDLLGLTYDELASWLAERGQPAFRAKQLAGWIYESLAGDFAAMRTLPAALRAQLQREATIAGPRVPTTLPSKDRRTR